MFLQSLVISGAKFVELTQKTKSSHQFNLNGKIESFNNLFFMEDIEEAGLKDSSVIVAMHSALNIGNDADTEIDLATKLVNIELAGVVVNRQREDEEVLLKHDYPRTRAGAFPKYRQLSDEFRKENEGFYPISQYIEDFQIKFNTKPDISKAIMRPRNWAFTPIFVDKGGALIK
jgi:hypothetical protein